MYTITGATGQVGSAVTERLLADGAAVRVLVRDPHKGDAWAARGAEVVVGDLSDRAALAAAFAGSDGVFALLPFDPTAADLHAHADAQVRAIAGAVADSGVPHVAVLSSVGADLTEGTGPIVALHHLEEQLRATGAIITAVRSGHFQEKVREILDVARDEGIYPVFGDSADVAHPLIATRDIGAVVAEALEAAPADHEIIDLDGPAYTERQVAALLGAALDRDLQVTTIPQPAWEEVFVAAGMSPDVARVMVGLYDADQRGVLVPRGDRTVRCETELATTLAEVVAVPA